jgi:heme exporter protein B
VNTETAMQAWLRTVKCELLRAYRQRSDIITPLVFFIIVTSLFPLGVGPEPETLRIMAPGVIWVAALLATLLSLQRLFGHELNDGTLEQLLLSPQSASLLISAKVFTHWLTTGLPLVVISPLLGIQLGLSDAALMMILISLLLGTPILSLIGAIGAALTLGLRGGGVLLALLILPLYIPVLIFASSAVVASTSGYPTEAQLSLLAAYLCIGLVFAPWACAASLRISLD